MSELLVLFGTIWAVGALCAAAFMVALIGVGGGWQETADRFNFLSQPDRDQRLTGGSLQWIVSLMVVLWPVALGYLVKHKLKSGAR